MGSDSSLRKTTLVELSYVAMNRYAPAVTRRVTHRRCAGARNKFLHQQLRVVDPIVVMKKFISAVSLEGVRAP